jgi:hypothetical protein
MEDYQLKLLFSFTLWKIEKSSVLNYIFRYIIVLLYIAMSSVIFLEKWDELADE